MNKTSANQQDGDWIRATLEGDSEAFGQLVRKYQDRLFNGLVQMLRNETEAEDVVQETFILAFTKLKSFQGKSAFYTWLYRIAYNVSVSRMRRRRPVASIHPADHDEPMQLPGRAPSPDAGVCQQERAGQLALALDRLSEEHRAILVLREIDDLDYEAIAEVLNIPVGTVRSRLHRARLQLKEQLELLDLDGT